MKTKTNVVPGWLSPSAVMDMLFDVREPGCEELGIPNNPGVSRPKMIHCA